ncbi:MAG: ATP-binding cassette domain-containing protein [Actinocrinis sp.]
MNAHIAADEALDENVVEVGGLRKVYGDTVAVDDVSFQVRRGEIFGLIGPNGAGKTTTVECLSGLRVPDAGSLRVLGMQPRGADGGRLREHVGVQLQQSALPARIRVGEALRLYASFYPNPADPDTLLDTLGLTEKRGTAYRKLSGGQKQQLAVNVVLALIVLGLLLGVGTGAYGLSAPRQPAGFALALVLGTGALFSLGLWVAAVARTGKAAQAIGGGLFFPLEFLAGLWVPRQVMPSGLRDVSDLTPLGAAVSAIQDGLEGRFPAAKALLVMVGWALAFGYAAVRMFSWE